MKKFWFIPVCAILVTSCSSTWEYKVITVSGVEGARADFDPKNLTVDEAALTAWGMEGWELVSAYPTTSTAITLPPSLQMGLQVLLLQEHHHTFC